MPEVQVQLYLKREGQTKVCEQSSRGWVEYQKNAMTKKIDLEYSEGKPLIYIGFYQCLMVL